MVTWDEYSLFLKGERLMIFSGEVHPWRLPVADLWIDVFQKIRALGFNCVSFYMHWGLVEYKQGEFDFDGIRSYDQFFAAAKEAGIYLIARPGPYINAETTGGGFPGWGTRVEGAWRSNNATYLAAIKDYVFKAGAIVAEQQITKGGPVILFQPENEFSMGQDIPWPQPEYMETLQDWFRETGIVVPMILNDVSVDNKNYAPGSGQGEVDIYGYDGYPQGFDCANPYTWVDGKLPTSWYQVQKGISPTTPNSVLEFQGGAFDPWGGPGYEACAVLLNHEFERVFYKNKVSFATTILNIYMIFGGTNWGGIAHPGVYTSYDYGSAIREDRGIDREKYSELKLQAQFLKVSPAYLTSKPQNLIPSTITGAFTNSQDLAVTHLVDEVGNKTAFYVTRHAKYNSKDKTAYKWTVSTSKGKVTVPQLQGALTLDGRDSKIHVTDYAVGKKTIVYSSGEILTWKAFKSKTVLILYGAAGETHETAFAGASTVKTISGKGLVKSTSSNETTILNYETNADPTILSVGSDLTVLLVDRNYAYDFWVPNLPAGSDTFSTKKSVIVHGTYLVRSATVAGSILKLQGDLNATAPIEVFAEPSVRSVLFNGKSVAVKPTAYGSLKGSITFAAPKIAIPDLKALSWKYIDSLPELKSSYDDSAWTAATHKTTPNPRKLTTPTSLYSSDYGYHTGTHLWRGHFTSTGAETSVSLQVAGGAAFGFTAWLNGAFLGSHAGTDRDSAANKTFALPSALKRGSKAVITVLQDHMGLQEDWWAGSDEFKTPRGIMSYSFPGSPKTAVAWKVTGNLGGESHRDKVRGPLNEGGLYVERQGFHQPSPPSSSWKSVSPYTGLSAPGVGFYTTTFPLSVPAGYDAPLQFKFSNCTGEVFRAQLYVNGYQMGKYVNHVGPQTVFPVPEGVLNHRGGNTLGVTLWAQAKEGAKVCGLVLEQGRVAKTALKTIGASAQPGWKKRRGAY
ncbi:glycoside hydrolase superfamily [Geopyxis carbonaria]|nr:glycoside hydrolase superfamily [Geopyxis carbonaria]